MAGRSVTFDAIPAELAARRAWVVWKAVDRGGRTTKVPYRCDGAGNASSTDPATWGSFEQAVAAADALACDGIGYVFSADDPYFGLDLDGELSAADRAAIVSALDTYTEESVSGNGFHVIGRGSIEAGRHPKGLGAFDRGRYFVMTGRHVRGTPTTIEDRQAQLDDVLERFLPKPAASVARATDAQPVDLDDQELLERALRARNGTAFAQLWRGDTAGHADDHSAADLALCAHLAFWTGRDPSRMDNLFRASGLMRDKWLRDDYRQRTIEAAIAGCQDAYQPPEPKVRPSRDAPGTHPESAPAAGVKGAGASLRPDVVGTQDGTHPPQPPSVDESRPSLVVVEAAAFAAVTEASAEPLLGDGLLAAGGSAVWYGDGGAGKTTLGLDQVLHLCSGRNWLGLTVHRPTRVLWIENEGPRGKFREKLRAKLDAWDGPDIGGRLHVLEQPWSLFTFRSGQHRAELVALVRDLAVDVVFAGPVQRLGVEGGGTPSEIQAFVDLLELVRADLDRPLAYELIHHENKSGDVSGAWEGATDTLAHVQARGNGHTSVFWRKVRWDSEMHGRTWKLNWRPGEQFQVDDTPETTDESIADQLLALVREAPGKSWNGYDELLQGKGSRKRHVRDELLEDGRLVNAGTAKSMRLFLPGQAPQAALDEDAA